MRRKVEGKVYRAGDVPVRESLHDRSRRLADLVCKSILKGGTTQDALLLTQAQTHLLEATRCLERVQVSADPEPCPICRQPFEAEQATLESRDGVIIHAACHGAAQD